MAIVLMEEVEKLTFLEGCSYSRNCLHAFVATDGCTDGENAENGEKEKTRRHSEEIEERL